jgi:PhzF family phenazine biosynthesis protein
MKIELFQVDAFTKNLFSGNPAAVCPLPAWLSDEKLQAIANENNLSETAFFVGKGDSFQIRWFTPSSEVDLCGHATLASAYVIDRFISPIASKLRFSSRSGELSVFRKEERLCLDFPAQKGKQIDCPRLIEDALGLRPVETLLSQAHIAVLASEDLVRSLSPRLDAISKLESLGLLVTAPGSYCDFVSRCFFPQLGITEDPVTGSAHCALAPYWADRLQKTELNCRQISRRGGELQCEVKNERVEIAGHCVLFLKGQIEIE